MNNKFDSNKKIFIANDHAGFQLKHFLIKNNSDLKWEDLGIFNKETSNYPEQATKLCQLMLKNQTEDHAENDEHSFGVLVCGSGQGMAMKANRFSKIRAAVAWNEDSARLAREHNNANVLCLGSRLLSFEKANHIFTVFINTAFKGGRHLERINSLD